MNRNTQPTNSILAPRLRLSAVVFAVALIAACGPQVDLPPMVEIETSELLNDVAAQIDAGYAAAMKAPKNAKAAGQYGLIVATYGRDEAADIAFQRARLLQPKEARWAFFHSFVLRRLGKTDEALAAADAGLAASPDQIDLVVKRGELLFDLARFDEAEAELDKALAENPKYPLAQYYKGRIHLQQKDWPMAVKRFETMLGHGIKVDEVHYNLSTAHRMAGNQEKAETHLNMSKGGSNIKIAGFDPVNMQFARLNVGDQPHILRAAEYYRNGKVDKAIEELETAYSKDPNNIGTHTNLVRMYGHDKQLDKALEHYEKAKLLDPDFNQLDSNLGFAYQTSGDFDNAAKAYSRAAQRTPNDSVIQAELGFALGKSGNLEQGVIHLQRSLELQPVNRDLRYMLGEALVKQRQFAEAIGMFKSALIPEDQKTIVVLRSLARTHVLSGNKDSALESLGEALKLAQRFDNKALVEALESDIERVNFSNSKN